MPQNEHVHLEKHTVTISINLTYQFFAAPYSREEYNCLLNTLGAENQVPEYKGRVVHPSGLNFLKIAQEIAKNGIGDLSADLVEIVKTKHKKISFKIEKKQIKNWAIRR